MNISAFDIHDRYDELTKKGAVYSYLGGLQSKEMNTVLKSVELILEASVSKRPIRKKIFNILIEITQNLHNYFDGHEALNSHKDLFLLVKETGEDYTILTGNFLLNKEIPGIRTRIDMVNVMDETEVKELYRGILNFGGVSQGGGAGLGFVDLARRSGKNLKYKFEDIDEKFSFFTLEVIVTN